MHKGILPLGGLIWVLLSISSALAQGTPDPESPRYKGLVALSQFMRTTGEEDIESFISELVSRDLRSQHDAADLRRLLAGLREEFSGIEVRGGQPRGPYSAAISFAAPGKQGGSSVPFEVEPDPPHRFVSIDFGSDAGGSSAGPQFSTGQLSELIESIAQTLIEGYIYEDRGRELAGVDSLIIDLRYNGGGGEPMVRYLSAYLFAVSTHLVDTFMRGWDEPRQRWTSDDVAGKRLPNIPVYLLTSRRTFSAAESFTFGLKVNQRGTLVGERTGGGGHFGGIQPLISGFSIWLPQGRTYDPKTGEGWEAEGIEPDIATSVSEALDVAHKAALKKIGH